MSRTDIETQARSKTSTYSVQRETCVTAYEPPECVGEQDHTEEVLVFEDLLKQVSSVQDILAEISKQITKKGVAENVEDFAVQDCRGDPLVDA